MTNKDRAKNISLISVNQPLVSTPPYRGNLLDYIRKRQEEEFNIKSSVYDKEKLTRGYGGSFVIQEHRATKLHYDLRLEFPKEDGSTVLRSFAIPQAKLPEEGQRFLAIETEDHPMSYKDFEGEIPEGQYGAGEVSIEDKGKFKIIDSDYDNIYEMDFEGKDLRGSYTLLKFEDGKWLFFPSSGKKSKVSKKAVKLVKHLEMLSRSLSCLTKLS